jgi:chemotaxis protein histidine kinase CheA
VGEVILSSSQLRTASRTDGAGAHPSVAVGLDRMDRAVADLQWRAFELRTTPLRRIVEPLPRMAREIAQRAGKRVEVAIHNAEIELDRSILDRLSDPLVHLFRNASRRRKSDWRRENPRPGASPWTRAARRT